MKFIVREGGVAVLFQQGRGTPCVDELATPFASKEEAWQAAQQHFTDFTVESAPPTITHPPPTLPRKPRHPITTDGANGNAARELEQRPAPSIRLADREEASAVAMCLLAKSAGHVSAEVTRKLVAVVNGRATVPEEVVEEWRNIVDGVVPPMPNDPSSPTAADGGGAERKR